MNDVVYPDGVGPFIKIIRVVNPDFVSFSKTTYRAFYWRIWRSRFPDIGKVILCIPDGARWRIDRYKLDVWLTAVLKDKRCLP